MKIKVEVVKLESFGAILEEIENFQSASTVSWYRGCSDAKHKLIPSLYRHPVKTSFSDLLELEREVTTRFVQRSLPFVNRPMLDEWDKLFLMQHYGVPTRLLDWSENPFVSIYFALSSTVVSKSSDAALWMIDPVAWNQAALKHISYKGGVLDPSHRAMNSYAPGTVPTEIPTMPIMVYGSYNSPRIVAQRGGFALFGQQNASLNEAYERSDYQPGIIKKIEIPHAKIDEIKKSLFRKGFTESVVFPDLEGLAKELKRGFGF